MLKRIAAVIMAAAIAVSAMPVMAHSSEVVRTSEIKLVEFEAYGKQPTAELFAYEDDALYNELVSRIEEKLEADTKHTIVVDGLENFGLDMKYKETTPEEEEPFSDDYVYLREVCDNLVKQYNIKSIDGMYNENYILEKLTFEIDNSMSIDDIVAAITKEFSGEFKGGDEDNTEIIINDLPMATINSNLSEIIYRLQFENAEKVYIDLTRIASGSGVSSYSQNPQDAKLNFTAATIMRFKYLPLTIDEYKAFEKKLDDIVEEIIYPDMTDAQKAMALHDWIIDNVKYGYRLDASIYSGKPTTKSDIIFNIAEYENLMNMLGSSSYETMATSKSYAHNAYAPAMKGYGVCQGYTMLYSLLLDKIGIENGVYISPVMDHQWSLLEIDGQWYHTDVTWDDPTPVVDNNEDGYETIALNLSNGSKIKLYTQTEQNHNYRNFLISEEECIAVGHSDDSEAISIPDVECTDEKFHAKETVDGEECANYVFGKIYYTKLNYSNYDKMYYYEQNMRVNGKPEVWYYRLPFVLKNADGTFAQPEKVSEKVFEAVIEGKKPDKDDDDDDDKHDKPDLPPADEYVTVQIPDETVIDNSVDVECKVDGEEGDSLTMENIGTSVITITQKEEAAEQEVSEVDAYLVYYGENNTIMDIIMKTVVIDGSGDIQFDGALPDGAVEAKIIILDGNSELVPVIKALGVTAEVPEVPAA